MGVALSRELIEKEKVVAAVGFANTGVALPSAKVFQEAKVPLIISASAGAYTYSGEPGPDGLYRNPFVNRYTSFSVDLIVDVVSFLMCAALLTDLRPHIDEAGSDTVRKRLRTAWRYINETPALRTCAQGDADA